ncbi:MAG: M28 family peptidase, partial [Gemmatimonadota bacterium]
MPPSPAVASLESMLLDDLSVELGWTLIERFSTLVRESGSEDERAAADHIAAELERLGIEHEVYEPRLYLSLPRESWVEAGGERFRAKPPSFASPTGAEGLVAELIHVPAERMRGMDDLFAARHGPAAPEVAGKIVLTEGYAMPLTVQRFERAGALGQIYTNPGDRVHWGICTPIWGTPTTRNLADKPSTPVLAVSRPDGERLRMLATRGPRRATLHARLEEGWAPCKLPVARIRGESDAFFLAHGHYDSWDVGIGDNAVGDAALLEIARLFHAHRDRLPRSLWIAWWPGHSTGRYAGSTWFADRFALELRKRCVGALNIDSPGCWHATAYEDVQWMAEAESLCRGAIRDAAGAEATGHRPLRAGDYSFDQIGLTSFFMLLSSIPKEERETLGFYPTGGCGGNIAWHTEADTREVADRETLARDLQVYVTALARVLAPPILPYDFRATTAELGGFVDGYRETAGDRLDLAVVEEERAVLARELDALYAALESAEPRGPAARAVDEAHVELGRILVPIGYAAGERFDHDPALPRPGIPRLAGVRSLDT